MWSTALKAGLALNARTCIMWTEVCCRAAWLVSAAYMGGGGGSLTSSGNVRAGCGVRERAGGRLIKSCLRLFCNVSCKAVEEGGADRLRLLCQPNARRY